MSYRTLIDTNLLARHVTDDGWAVVDCSFRLDAPSWGEREYAARHIPGAVYAHLNRDLSGEITGSNGRHPLPDPSKLADLFGRLGIASDTQVAVYDQDCGMFASRLWWLLRWLGHDRVCVLDGGLQQWLRDGRVTRPGHETRTHSTFSGRPHPAMSVSVDDVAAGLSDGRRLLIDARAPERFRGEQETIDRAAGHIPGAINHFFRWNLGADGRFLSSTALQQRLRSAMGDAPADKVVCYCGSGVTACHTLLALEHVGLSGAKLYPGSWSEWSSDPKRPVAQGDASPISSGPARKPVRD